jgi:hypothetical protein
MPLEEAVIVAGTKQNLKNLDSLYIAVAALKTRCCTPISPLPLNILPAHIGLARKYLLDLAEKASSDELCGLFGASVTKNKSLTSSAPSSRSCLTPSSTTRTRRSCSARRWNAKVKSKAWSFYNFSKNIHCKNNMLAYSRGSCVRLSSDGVPHYSAH